ncbi:MAG: MBL fold metallo-hydrolase [Oscillospiraceae bacterium]|nr:MBL fold metallo-hydrolase [Oscillospiraceae bacterium]
MAKFYPLFSSSQANASYIGNSQAGILVDAGASCKKILSALSCNAIRTDCIQGIFVTHTHSDHIKGLKTLVQKLKVPVYGTSETLEFLSHAGDKYLSPGTELIRIDPRKDPDAGVVCGDCEVRAFPTMHDEPGSCGYRVHTEDDKYCAVCTDLGIVTPEVRDALTGCDMILLESNYEPDLLWQGDYPYHLKQRISSDHGHLSNQDCADFSDYLIRTGTTRLLLGHLSQNSNTPELAAGTTVKALTEYTMGTDYLLGVAPVETPGGAVIF